MQNPVYVLRKGHQRLFVKTYSGEAAQRPGPVWAGLHTALGLPVGCWVPLETLLSALSAVAWQVWEPLNEARLLVVAWESERWAPGCPRILITPGPGLCDSFSLCHKRDHAGRMQASQ